jgi:acyl-CoA thioesterase
MFSSQLIEQYAKSNHFGELIGMHCEIPVAGKVNYYITIEDKHLATPIAAHGGVIASLMDAALGVACLSAVVNDNKVVSTLDLSLRYLKPAVLGATIVAKSEVISKGNRILVSEVKVYDGETLIASGSGTFNAYPKEKAGY